MDILIFETRDKNRIEIQYGQVANSNIDVIIPGDFILRISHPGGSTQIMLNPEQWGRLVDCLAGTMQVKH